MSGNTLRRIEHELFIRSFMAFNPDARVTQQLTTAMKDVEFEPGELIYQAGEPARHAYFIVSGGAQLSAPGSIPWDFEDESVIGMLDGLLERDYSRTARAISRSQMIALSMADYFDVLEDNFEYARRMIVVGAQQHDALALEVAPEAVFAADPDEGAHEPPSLDHPPLNTIERLLALRASGFVARAPVQALASLAQLAEQTSFAAGSPLFRAGEANDKLYIVVSGRVRVQRRSPAVNALFLPVRLVTGLSALGHDEHVYDATAETDVSVLGIAKEDLFDVAEDHFRLARALFAYSALERERIMALSQERAPHPQRAVLPA